MTITRSIEHNRRTGFASLTEGGLRTSSFPMRLFRRGNQKFWHPDEIDFSLDSEHFAALNEHGQAAVTGSASAFMAGEESVTQDIQPFMHAMAAEGRLADEAYLTQFAFEEAKHMQGFRMWLDAVGVKGDLHEYTQQSPAYEAIFKDALPKAMYALVDDPSPAAQIRASVLYNHIVEGTLALTGYYSWSKLFRAQRILPGMQKLIKHISDDERRHMAWGTFTCRRHVAADDANWAVVEDTVAEFRQPALDLLTAGPERNRREGRQSPFGTTPEEITRYATERLNRRVEAIRSARGRPVHEIDEDYSPMDLEDRLGDEDGAARVPAVS
ncbi:MAG TPA: R2-like ligand-binding oxidase [Pseudonocardia sp.]|nr:R2-like ligand-binding oxidase [Pseudonocardia sp.]